MTGLWDGFWIKHDAPIAAVGECMIEIVRRPDGGTAFGYAGDTLNTAVYMARLGLRPHYVTALGTDPFSDAMLAFWTTESIATDLVARRADKLPGLYIVTTDVKGERRFHYWRNDSAARTLFTRPEDNALLHTLEGCALVYWSGISLAILAPQARQALLDLFARRRPQGMRVAFDTNYRPRLWPAVEAARTAYGTALAQADLVLTSIEDEGPIFGGDEAALIARHRTAGVAESVIKTNAPGSRVVIPGETVDLRIDAPPVATVVDTTAAGDSFAAAYIAGRIVGKDARAAALDGHRLAGAVVGVRGAILPRDAMPTL
jgi:2-dehydro-3-deoxygluconokinase